MPPHIRATDPGLSFFADAGAGTADIKLAYAVDANLEIALLIGEPGLGKTTVLRHFSQRESVAGNVVVDIFFPQLAADDLLAFIDGEMSANDDFPNPDRHISLRRIARRANRLARDGRALVIVIDDAHLVTERAVWETLQSLLNLRDREGVRLTFVLAGETPLLANLSRIPAFAGRVGVTAVLSPLDLETTKSYVRHRLSVAGNPTMVFPEDVIDRLHRETRGVPRAINRVVNMVTLLARADGRQSATLADLENLASEIGVRCEAA